MQFAPKYHRNHEQRSLKDVIWQSGTTEAMKTSLTDCVVTDGCALITSNEFYSFISELDKYSSSKGDKNFFCDLYDGLGIKRCTRGEGSIFIDNTNISITGLIQPDHISNILSSGNDPDGLFKRFLYCAPNINFGHFDDMNYIDDDNYHIFSRIW